MIRSNKGASTWMIFLIFLIFVLIVGAFSYFNIGGGMEGFPSTPQGYADSWGKYAESTFTKENQPWNVMSMFFFPLVIYFTIFYMALNAAMLGVSQYAGTRYSQVERPIIVLCFAISFMILPLPTTSWIYGVFSILGPISPWVPFALIIIGFALLLVGGGRAIRDVWPAGVGIERPDVGHWEDRLGDIRDRINRARGEGRPIDGALRDLEDARRRIGHLRGDVESVRDRRPDLREEANRIINGLNNLETDLGGVERRLRDARREEEIERERRIMEGINTELGRLRNSISDFLQRAAEPPVPSPTSPETTWTCPDCGTENPHDANFCANCRAPREKVGAPSAPTEVPLLPGSTLREEWRVTIEKIKRVMEDTPKFSSLKIVDRLPTGEAVEIENVVKPLNDNRKSIISITKEMISALQGREEFQKLFTEWHSGTIFKDLQKEMDNLKNNYDKASPIMARAAESCKDKSAANYLTNFFTKYFDAMKFLDHVRYTELETLRNRTIKTLKL